jgi:hypothetical protein
MPKNIQSDKQLLKETKKKYSDSQPILFRMKGISEKEKERSPGNMHRRKNEKDKQSRRNKKRARKSNIIRHRINNSTNHTSAFSFI